MSNAEAARLYESIIEDVIAESRQDFEDSGIDETTLQDLRKLWRDRLSLTKVAVFPWDPAPDSVPELDSISANQIAAPQQIHSQQLLVPQSDISLPMPKTEDQQHIMLPGGGIVNQADGGADITFELDEQDAMKLRKYEKKIQRKRLLKQRQEARALQGGLVTQADGGDDSDDSVFGGGDSDDINSDLDDPDDDELNSDDDNEDQEGNIMLCLYDRVQRVKNKWKCTLKDGVTNIDGKDYAFQKATGDSEW
ncbi:unnamed protein product [Kuraishia capsulata CBS 1993]|uniref:Transcription initiation factor IIA large subunit n=1 Tax=Kuraishia capsulata CBS 1993 TaxID=1382522 RepID=W6MFN9_9ASCO|nr:uncharacterized protein KUCA_T00000143001 [Kuraishia capsulata CBS 1993]CDK24183.1 unnamed protein product [Kuraishia capsulata CBS 1993]